MNMREKRIREFEDSYIPEPNSGCWLWDRRGKNGPMEYGYFTFEGTVKAHRAAWLIHKGPIPKDAFVLHKCDNPSCVNPDHLYLGHAKENVSDRDRRSRTKGFAGKNSVKTHCVNGHAFTEENTKMRGVWRICRKCGYEATKRLRARKRGVA